MGGGTWVSKMSVGFSVFESVIGSVCVHCFGCLVSEVWVCIFWFQCSFF